MKDKFLEKDATTILDTPPFKAVIFDMDGTLIESTEADFLAWERLFADYGKTLTYQQYLPMLGIKSVYVIRDYLGVTDKGEVERCLQTKWKYFVEVIDKNGMKEVEGALEFVKKFRQVPMKVALATSSRRPKVDLIMAQLGFINYFDAIVSGDEVERSKPAPDIFIRAAEKLQMPPADCIVIEDAVNGVTAANKAGMKCVAITTTNSAEALSHADVVIESFDDKHFDTIFTKLSV